MSGRRVLDSYAILAFLENEPGADKVAEIIKQARDKDKPLFMSVINWGEVYYIVKRTAGVEAAEDTLRNLGTLPIEIINVDRDLTKIAAEYKSSRKMSYADCFAAALAKRESAEVLTGDPEFRQLEKEIKVRWLPLRSR